MPDYLFKFQYNHVIGEGVLNSGRIPGRLQCQYHIENQFLEIHEVVVTAETLAEARATAIKAARELLDRLSQK